MAVVRVCFACCIAIGLLNSAQAQDVRLTAAEAARRSRVPAGFSVVPFAAEPDVVQPIAFTFDDRGRMWVVECLSYPNFTTDGAGRDRVTILADEDGDGRMDRRTVFMDSGANLSGIEWGHGGVWLCSSPNLLFVPDRDGNGAPDGPPEIVLDGWDATARHNVFNGLTWGPDGWLYGCNGILSNSRVGAPGADDANRTPLNCGVWRFHPIQRRFEAVAHGTTNPWGLDFDDRGEMFITNCVIKHLFHVTPGSHLERMFGQDIDPYSYSLTPSCADHLHWAGGYWDTEGVDKPENDPFGGGHAHSGAMIYLGDNWPDEYRNRVFSLNIHGRRLNRDRLEPHGSGYIARHEPDAFRSDDPFFRGVAVKYGPDGGVFVADWSDSGECHDYEEVQRESGRIYKIAHGKIATARPFDLAKLTDEQLVALQLHKNDWHVRHARRILAERHAAGTLKAPTRDSLRKQLAAGKSTSHRLRSLWALHAVGVNEPAFAADRDDAVRAWGLRLLLDRFPLAIEPALDLVELATKDPSPLVRRELASALKRLPDGMAEPVALGLLRHEEDANDVNLPYLAWYGVEPLLAADPEFADRLLAATSWPLVRGNTARRLAAAGRLDLVVNSLARTRVPARQLELFAGLAEGLHGQRRLAAPESWREASERLKKSSDESVRDAALELALRFGETDASAAAEAIVRSSDAAQTRRERALALLIEQDSTGLAPLLFDLLNDAALRGAAIRGLAAHRDEATPQRLLAIYAELSMTEKSDVVATLASRKEFAIMLVDAIEKGLVPPEDVSPYVARQLAALKDDGLTARLVKAWGALRPASESKAELKAQLKTALAPEKLAAADTSRGRMIFAKTCAACHVMFDAGERIGPELTGAQRGNLDYVLDNVLDPSAVVPRDYQVTNVQTTDGRLIAGIVRQESERALTLQTANERVVVAKADIEVREPAAVSMMPEGLFAKLAPDEIRDLVAYLATPRQVGLPAEE